MGSLEIALVSEMVTMGDHTWAEPDDQLLRLVPRRAQYDVGRFNARGRTGRPTINDHEVEVVRVPDY